MCLKTKGHVTNVADYMCLEDLDPNKHLKGGGCYTRACHSETLSSVTNGVEQETVVLLRGVAIATCCCTTALSVGKGHKARRHRGNVVNRHMHMRNSIIMQTFSWPAELYLKKQACNLGLP